MRTIDRLEEANRAPLIEQTQRDQLALLSMALLTGVMTGTGVGIGIATIGGGLEPVALIAAAMLAVSGLLLGALTVRFKLRIDKD